MSEQLTLDGRCPHCDYTRDAMAKFAATVQRQAADLDRLRVRIRELEAALEEVRA